MKSMQEMHDKMMAAKTPEERSALMAEQMKTMQNGMTMMNGMSAGAMGGMKGDMAANHQMMEKVHGNDAGHDADDDGSSARRAGEVTEPMAWRPSLAHSSTGIALAVTVGLFYALCTLVWASHLARSWDS